MENLELSINSSEISEPEIIHIVKSCFGAGLIRTLPANAVDYYGSNEKFMSALEECHNFFKYISDRRESIKNITDFNFFIKEFFSSLDFSSNFYFVRIPSVIFDPDKIESLSIIPSLQVRTPYFTVNKILQIDPKELLMILIRFYLERPDLEQKLEDYFAQILPDNKLNKVVGNTKALIAAV